MQPVLESTEDQASGRREVAQRPWWPWSPEPSGQWGSRQFLVELGVWTVSSSPVCREPFMDAGSVLSEMRAKNIFCFEFVVVDSSYMFTLHFGHVHSLPLSYTH